LDILKAEGFIRGYSKNISQNKICISVLLKYTEFQEPIIKKIERISSPGKRIYVKSKSF